MKAVVVARPGGPEVLELRDVPGPETVADRVRVRVVASGVNRADVLQRRGGYPAPPGWPDDIPGLEFSGVVENVGPECRLRKPGDRVMGLVGGGGYAEYVVVDERETVTVPEALDLVAAGAVPEAFMTAFDAVHLQMGLTAGETLLIHAVGSGVGTAALQLARVAGARTLGTSRTPEKLERARALGLDVAVEGGGEDWPDRVMEATGGRGVDVVLDLVGAPYVSGNLEVLAPRGRWIVVGVPGGGVAKMDLRRLMGKRATLTGTLLRSRPREEKAALARAFESRVAPLFGRGLLEPVVDEVHPAREAA
ncbi:MAG TPA: NAD(P)H-quinone oxidoreductase, partial [Longimicrobiales bacterium]|nr:NAD(P)H-quinone oxidoreductase [Longimicrobiales bacterium]